MLWLLLCCRVDMWPNYMESRIGGVLLVAITCFMGLVASEVVDLVHSECSAIHIRFNIHGNSNII